MAEGRWICFVSILQGVSHTLPLWPVHAGRELGCERGCVQDFGHDFVQYREAEENQDLRSQGRFPEVHPLLP